MRMVKQSITLPEDIFKFVEKRASQIGREKSERPNVSSVIRELLLKEKQRVEQKQAA